MFERSEKHVTNLRTYAIHSSQLKTTEDSLICMSVYKKKSEENQRPNYVRYLIIYLFIVYVTCESIVAGGNI